jgi:hypothetical protein
MTSDPVIDGTQLEMKINQPLPTHSSNNVCLCTVHFKPRLAIRFFFLPVLLFCSFFPSSLLFFFHCHSLYSTTSNERANEQTNKRTNGNSPLFTSSSSFAYHYQLFVFCIAPLSFDTRSATTMTTAIGTTTMLMTTPTLLHVAQKGTFQNFQM